MRYLLASVMYRASPECHMESMFGHAPAQIHKETGKKVHLLLPDGTEYRRAMGL